MFDQSLLTLYGMGLIIVLLLTLLILVLKKNNQSQKQIGVTQRLVQEKAHILTAASHDLRQPLLAQGLFIAELKDIIGDEKSDLLQIVDMLETSNESMHRLVSSVLEISQLDSCKVQPNFQHLTVSALLDDLVVEYKPRAKQKKLGFKSRPIEGVILTDADLLMRILRNILSNAIRYTNKGEIVLSCSVVFKHLCIEISDTGIGIPRRQLQAIFKEFYQIEGIHRGADSGLGLGLSIVDRLAKLLNHEVKVSSVVGKGTTFKVYVPFGLPYVYPSYPQINR